MVTGSSVALTVLAAASIPNIYGGFLPTFWEIGSPETSARQDSVYWIRRGEIVATGISLAIGVAASVVDRTPLAFIGVLIMVGVLLYLYEHALRHGTSGDIIVA